MINETIHKFHLLRLPNNFTFSNLYFPKTSTTSTTISNYPYKYSSHTKW